MPFRVGEYVTVTGPGPQWHGEIIARLGGSMFRVRFGGTSGGSMLSNIVHANDLQPIMPDRRVIRRVIVGLFKANTQACQKATLQQRMDAIEAALAWLKTYVDTHEPLEGNEHRIRCIFLAPEYMFANPIQADDHQSGHQRQIEKTDNHRLRTFFARVSEGFRNALIIPGSVAWRKPLVVDSDEQTLRLKALSKGLTVEQYRDAYRRDKYQKAMFPATSVYYPYAQDTQYNTDDPWATLVSPTSYAYGKTVYSYGNKWWQLKAATYIAKNTAHCYYNGTCIAKYNKIGDFHEVLHGTDTVHIPNPLPGRFACGGMQFGISICYDQSLSKMVQGNSVLLQRTRDSVDFHILLSAQISPDVNSANLLEEGHLLSCSSANDNNQVLDAAGKPLVKKGSKTIAGVEMDVYRV